MSNYFSLYEKKTTPPFNWIRVLIPIYFLFNFCLTSIQAQITPADAALFSACELEVSLESMTFSCDGANVCIDIQNGTAPYTITLDGPSPNPEMDNLSLCFFDLSPGNYTITVSDAESCTMSLDLNIPVVDYYVDADISHVSCHGGNDGFIHPLILIDIAPLFFSWEGPNGFTADTESIDQLEAGTYSVSVSALNDVCVAIGSWEVTQPDPIEIETELTYPVCGQPDGCLFVEGGIPPYYIWILEELPDDIADDPSGPLPPLVDLDPTLGFPYDPMNSDTAVCGTNLQAGTFFILVLDSHLCYAWETLTIDDNPVHFDRDVDITDVSCHGGNDGALCYTITGGEPPYGTYLSPSISNLGIIGDQGCFENLAAGNYIMTTTDANGCTLSETFTIGQPDQLSANFEITDNDCNGNVGGCLTVSGGTLPYYVYVFTHPDPTNDNINVDFTASGLPEVEDGEMIDWFDFQPNTDPTYEQCAENITPGFYLIVVVDGNGCYILYPLIIPDGNGLSAEFEERGDPCDDQVDGCLNITGGVMPYRVWVWTWPATSGDVPEVQFNANGQPYFEEDYIEPTDVFPPNPTTPDYQRCVEDIPPGHYLILVMDAAGCYDLIVVHIEDPNPLQAHFERTNSVCEDGVDGCLTIEGGTVPYHVYVLVPEINSTDLDPDVTFDDNGNPIVDNAQFTDEFSFDGTATDPYVRCAENIPPGRYWILVVDANLCYVLLHINIPFSDPLHAEFEITNEQCGQVDGCLKIDGGTQPYHVYVFTHPDPTLDHYEVDFTIGSTPTIDGGMQTDVIDFQADPSDPNSSYIRCAEDIPPGFYLVLVVDANLCYDLVLVHIPDGDGLLLETDVEDVSCYGYEDGSISLTISGGVAPYTIVFEGQNSNHTDNSLSVSFFDLAAGVYSITVYDAEQCSASIIVVVGSPEEIQSNLEFDTYGEFACVDPTGGVSPYEVSWFDFTQNTTFSNDFCVYDLEPGAYWVSIEDANACSTDDILIIDPFVCAGGEASLDPEEIHSGESTTFHLSNYGAESIQWQFKTEFTPWLPIPGANEDTYTTAPIHTGTDKEILVRAEVTCPNGDVLYSTEAVLTVIANSLLMPVTAMVEDPNLFNPNNRKAELASLQLLAEGHSPGTSIYPTITRDEIKVHYEFNTTTGMTISVVNQLGRLIYQEKVNEIRLGQFTSLSAQNWGSGAYFIRLESEYGVETHRVIVQK